MQFLDFLGVVQLLTVQGQIMSNDLLMNYIKTVIYTFGSIELTV